MTKKYHDTEYLYLSACIHSWETRLLTPERREQLLSAPTDRDAARVLEEMGWPAFDPESEAALDQAVGQRREELFARLGKDMPDARILDVFRLPTDYHNLKVLVKSRGEDCRRLLMAGGRWDLEQLLSDYRQRELRDFLPAETAQAVQQARQALAETGNGQACDLVLDGTCFRELTRLADAVGCPALTDYLRTRIDGVNLCSAVRARRLRKGPGLSAQGAAGGRQRSSGSAGGGRPCRSAGAVCRHASAGSRRSGGGHLRRRRQHDGAGKAVRQRRTASGGQGPPHPLRRGDGTGVSHCGGSGAHRRPHHHDGTPGGTVRRRHPGKAA